MNKLFEEMNELIKKQNDEEFEFFIEKYKDELIKEDPIIFISNHVSYYAFKEDVDKVLEVITYYKNAPYISMKVEDLLNDLKKEIEKNFHHKPIKDEEVINALLSGNEELIAFALNYLSKANIRNFIKPVNEFLLQDIPYKYKTLVLFMLVEQKYEKEVFFIKNGVNYTIIPSYLDLPFDNLEYQETKKLIEEENIDPQIKKYAIEIMNICQIKEFPDSYLTYDNCLYMRDIFIDMANTYLHIGGSNVEVISKKYGVDLRKCQALINELNEIVSR